MTEHKPSAEEARLHADAQRLENWKRWGPYLAERQWGTVREDYSADGDAWRYFPHDHARSRAYRWGEDGLLGITDRECRLCFALAFWNGRDPILKERLFGLTNHEGNHGEDVKECYYYLDSTPTHSYMKALYKYPQREFPYARLVEENARRGLHDREFELEDTGIFDDDRYFDITVEYAKAGPDDILIRVGVANRGPDEAELHFLPTLWFRNTWSLGRHGEAYWPRPSIGRAGRLALIAEHETLGHFTFMAAPTESGRTPSFLFTENETNFERLFDVPNASPYVKDAFHEYVVHGRRDAVNPAERGTKAAAYYPVRIPARAETSFLFRLTHGASAPEHPFDGAFERTFARRESEADDFYTARAPVGLTEEERRIVRQGYAGLLWSKQFYFYVVREWLEGDPAYPPPPPHRANGRNEDWQQLYNSDVISMPDTWEYPWYASWDLAFHAIPLSRIDPELAKHQLVLFLREWYMHPSGKIPAYEWSFDDVNPPVHAWAVWRVYKMTAPGERRDRAFLERCFHKLLINFTWWVNRKDSEGNNLFGGGFLGLDNVGVFDRSQPLPGGMHLEQADGTAWMAFYCGTMLSMALELAKHDPTYEDVASKFFEHFVAITDAMNSLGGTGLWSEQVGFYTDQIHAGGRVFPLELRAAVGLIPLFAVEVLEEESMRRLTGFSKRTRWFLRNRPDLARHIAYLETGEQEDHLHRLLAIPSRERLERVLRYLLDEREFLAPYGVRSLSRVYEANPYKVRYDHQEFSVRYAPAESETQLFGSNSNWRGPVWFPLNFLIIEALERYHHFYGDAFRVECPVGSGRMLTLAEVARDLQSRLARIFLPGPDGRRPCHGTDTRYATDPDWKDLVLFYEFFDGETGRGCGASHQTGWTALVVRCIEDLARCRASSIDHRDSASSIDHRDSASSIDHRDSRLGTTAERG